MIINNPGGMNMPSIIKNLRVIFAVLTIAPFIQGWASDPDHKPSETSQTSPESNSGTSSADDHHKDNPMSHVMK